MNERSRQSRKGLSLALLVLAVCAVAVTGFSLANAVGTISAAAESGGTGAPAATSSAATGALTQVQGSSSPLSTSGVTSLGSVSVVPEPQAYNPNAPDSVTVTLTPSQSLTTLVNELSDVASPLYRHYLSASDLGSAYGSAAYGSTVAYFQSYGLSVQTSATSLSLVVSGTVAQIAAAFHTSLSSFATEYQSQGVYNAAFGNASGVAGTVKGPLFYSNTAPAELPASVAAAVNGIAGLDGMAASPSLSMPAGLYPGMVPSDSGLSNTSAAWSKIPCMFGVTGTCNTSLDSHQGLTSSYFLWTNFSQEGLTCQDYNICGQYQFLFPSTMPDLSGADNLWSGATTIDSEPDTGQGVTIAVVEVGCAIPSDLSQFSEMVYKNPNTLPDRVTQIAVNTSGGYALTGIPNTNIDNCVLEGEYAGWTLETEVDIEYASTMAPGAHIDVIGIPYPGYFADFDRAYADIAQYLALGSTGGTCASSGTLNAAGMYVVEGGLTGGACSVTITSNSYGEGEEDEYFEGSPMYISAEDQLLELLNAVGVTNFFSSGDSGGTYITVNDFSPADSPGATSVGGAQITAFGDGSEFPITSTKFTYCDGYEEEGYCYGAVGIAYFAPASSIGGAAYWSYSEGLGGTYKGVVGGGFGQSFVDSQPWWQNALDTYSTGAKIDPVIAGSAAFNMTVYVFGTWSLFWGGTSFACPIEAGEWALLEEQANVAFGNPMMGDINPLLFGAHNAFEAGAVAMNPYTPEQAVTNGLDAAPVDSFTWYYYNLSIEVPSAPVQPLWFPSLANPAGSGWNYLQGLGITNVGLLDSELIGQTGAAGHALANPAFSLFLVTESGLAPFTDPTLTAGTSYTFEVLDQDGQPGIYNVAEYSGQSNGGAYGGGVLTTVQTGSNGQFTYIPTTGTPPGGDAATTYAYFLVSSLVGASPEWAFVDYAVQAPTPSGTLSLCVVDPYGSCDTGDAETTMFTTTMTGYYNLFGQSDVWLNGLPVSGAVVTQVAEVVQFGPDLDPTLPPADYAPGTTIGQTISDARGEATFWTDALIAEHNGPLYTDVYTLTATYDGLTSNTVTVFVEPQAGSFYTGDLTYSSGPDPDQKVTGNLSFADMKYASYVNVSVGSSPGQYVNYTCPLPAGAPQPANTVLLPGCSPFYDTNFGADVWESGVDFGTLPVDLSTAGITGPVVVSEMAGGVNDLSFGISEYFDGFYYNFTELSVQNPIVWQDPLVFLNAGVSLAATGTVSGTDAVSWSGSAYPGAVGTLALVWGGGSEVLATYPLSPGDATSGTFPLDTTLLLDGSYSVTFTETAPGAAESVQEATFYSDNQAASTSALIAELQAQLNQDTSTIAALNAQVAALTADNAANASEVQTLQGDLSTLQAQLASAEATEASLQAQIASLSDDPGTIASLQAQLATAQATITTDQNEIASLQSQVQTLQNELNSKKGDIAPAWYDTFPGGGLAVAILFAGVGAVVSGLGVALAMRRRREAQAPSSERTKGEAMPAATNAPVLTEPTESAPRTPREALRQARKVLGLPLPTREVPEVPRGAWMDRQEGPWNRPDDRSAPEAMYR